MKDLQTKAFELLNAKFGNRPQIIKAIEELSELQQSLCHYLNKDVNDGSHMNVILDDIIEEIADVSIVCNMIIQMFDCGDSVNKIKLEKLNKVINNNS